MEDLQDFLFVGLLGNRANARSLIPDSQGSSDTFNPRSRSPKSKVSQVQAEQATQERMSQHAVFQ